jgi:excisionase family DNA binding protein
MADEDQGQKPAFLTGAEVAELLCMTPVTVWRLARKGQIPGAFRTGYRWLFPVEELERWIKATTPRTKE